VKNPAIFINTLAQRARKRETRYQRRVRDVKQNFDEIKEKKKKTSRGVEKGKRHQENKNHNGIREQGEQPTGVKTWVCMTKNKGERCI